MPDRKAPGSAPHMTPDEFRRRGRQVIDWIAGYMERVEEYPVLSRVKPGEIRDSLPAHPPVTGEAFDLVLADLERVIMPGITHWQSPGFHAYFNANASGPAILGDLVSSGLGVQGMLWATSPACTELETHVLDWLIEMLDLPDGFLSSGGGGGVIQDSASSASLTAIIAAREAATGGTGNRSGSLGNLTAYTSSEAHSSIEKGIRIAGIGSDNLRSVEVDSRFAMQPEALEAAVEADRAAGRRPFFVCATVGTTSSTGLDPVRSIGEICRRHGLWLHVDAALAGTAALVPEMRWIHDGLELADSYVFNPHKWMLTNFDCSAFYVADRLALTNALSVVPEYLRNEASASGEVIDYRDWQIPLGRRFRALKLWFVIRHYGIEGLQAFVREHLRLTALLADWVRAHDDFELAAPAPINLVCFRHLGGEEITRRIMDTVNSSGEMLLSHTQLDGKLTLRIAVGQTHTAEHHVRRAWERILQAAGA